MAPRGQHRVLEDVQRAAGLDEVIILRPAVRPGHDDRLDGQVLNTGWGLMGLI